MSASRGELRRQGLIDATVRVISRHGIEGATTRRIAAEAGASVASLHYHFDKKEDLYRGVYDHLAAVLRDSVWRVTPGAGLGRAAGNLLRQLFDWWDQQPDWGFAQLDLFLALGRQDPELANDFYADFVEILAANCRAGMAAGRDDELLIDPIVHLILAVSDGLLTQWRAHRDRDRIATDIEVAAESFERLCEARWNLSISPRLSSGFDR